MSFYPSLSQVRNPSNFINRACDVGFGNINTNVGRYISTAYDLQILSMSGSNEGVGTTGPQGVQGVNGMQGPVGASGNNGVQGVQGVQGVNGIQGPVGASGNNGVQGIQGASGNNGLQGVNGIQGVQGASGNNGSQGVQGSSGKSYLSMTGGLVYSTGPVQIQSTLVSTNYQTGALVVNGGVGIGGSLNVFGQIINPLFTTYRESLFTGTTSSNVTINCQTGNNFNFILSTNTTFAITSVPTGCVYGMNLYLTQDGVGSRLVTWPGTVSWGQAGAPTLTTTINKTDIINLVTINGGASWFGFLAGKEF